MTAALTAAEGFQPVDWALIAVIVVLLVASGLLALAETSLVRTSKVKAQSLLDDQRRGARQLCNLVEEPEQFLNPVLLLVLVCQLVSATLVGVLASAWLGALGVVVGVVFEVVVIFVLFEAVPKNWAVHNPERAALFSAPIVSALVAFPLVRAVSSVLIGLANLVIGRGSGDEDDAGQRDRVRTAGHGRRGPRRGGHRADRAGLHPLDHRLRRRRGARGDGAAPGHGGLRGADVTVSEALEEALAAGRSRVPVYQDNVDDVVGIAYAKDLMRAEHDGHGADPVRSHVRPAHFVPETKRLTGLLREMQERKVHLAIVVDEYGGTAGLVTLEDLIEELVGEIVDEYDVEEPAVERLPDGSWW